VTPKGIPWGNVWQASNNNYHTYEVFTMYFGFAVTAWALYAFYHCFTVWGIGVMGSSLRKN